MPKSPVTPEIKYPRLSIVICSTEEKTGVPPAIAAAVNLAALPSGGKASDFLSFDEPMNHLHARTLMGWTPEEEGGEKYGDDYLTTDYSGRKVRAANNVRNRPYYESLAEDRSQDILNKRWEFHGETIQVSREGWVLDGQHTCGGLIRAYERWLTEKNEKGERIWLELWPEDKYPEGPTIDKIIVYGIDSSDRVVNTMNTGRPRSLADVLYRSPYFASLSPRDRVTAGRVTSSAIAHVWNRTGMYLSNFGSRRTTAEAVAWLEAHGGKSGKFLAGVKVILSGSDRILPLVPLGYAACVLWIMACSDTDEDKVGKYYADDERSGKRLSFAQWDRAVEFFTEFGKTNSDDEPVGGLKELTLSLRAVNDSTEEGSNSAVERNYVITRAWNRYLKAKTNVRAEDVTLVYHRADRHGIRRLNESPELGGRLLGGIDLGAEKVTPSTPAEHTPDNGEPDVPRNDKVNVPVTGVAADGAYDLNTTVTKDHPEVGCVLVKTPTGSYAAWGDSMCAVVAPHVTKKPRMHPKGLVNISFRADETEQLVDLLTDAGTCVALVVENLAPVNGDAKYVIERKCLPDAKKRRAK